MKTYHVQGVSIPNIGFGTFRMPGGDAQPVVESALEVGYRHIDTAAMYDNEAAVGAALKASGIPREEVFITTKAWHTNLDPAALRASLDTSLLKLGLDRVDLFMVHWPSADMDIARTTETLTALRDDGRTSAIGVCNFTLQMLREAVEVANAPIAALQVEYHPFLDQSHLLSYVRARGIVLTAHAPLAQGRAATDPTLVQIGERHGCSAAQVAIAWLLEQDGVVAIPKSARSATQRANLEAAAIKLTDEDRLAIAALPKNLRYVNPPFAPDWDA